MTSSLLEDVARVVTDARRMEWGNDDPARYSKRVAKELALSILSDAVVRAARALELPKLIEDDMAAIRARSEDREGS